MTPLEISICVLSQDSQEHQDCFPWLASMEFPTLKAMPKFKSAHGKEALSWFYGTQEPYIDYIRG